MSPRLLDPARGAEADWPAGHEALRAYTEGFARLGATCLVANLRTKLKVLRCEDLALPVTINDAGDINSYVCSPYTAFALYSKEEMRLLESRLARRALGSVADGIGAVLKAARIDSMVQVNNWLLSTNLFPKRDLPIDALTDFLTAEFPNHYICFRSINRWDNAALLSAFAAAGYKLVATRQVYTYDRLTETWEPRSNASHDRRLLRRSRYALIGNDEFSESDYERVAELYHMLYIRKYSRHNPEYTAAFMRLCQRSAVMRFFGLRGRDGVLDGVLGLFSLDGTITAPIVGYDTTRDPRLGLYRLLMTLVFETALATGSKINLSSGAAGFKRLRGGQPFIEYSAIYDRHLPPWRRWAVDALALPLNSIGIPVMQRLRL